MRITTTQIAKRARIKAAQGSLPRLVHKLVHAGGTPTQVAFPVGNSTSLPGWDGELASEHDSPLVQKGKSFWGFSCEAPVTRKPNKDYDKRTRQALNEVHINSTFVFVSAHRWSQKAQWLERKREAGNGRQSVPMMQTTSNSGWSRAQQWHCRLPRSSAYPDQALRAL